MTRTASPAALKKRATVLVVDDDQSILKALSRLIRSAGLQVRTFDRPSSLLASRIPVANACLVIDINLPEMNGIELCHAIADSGHGLPIILITGRNPVDTRRIVTSVSTVAILYKPIDEGPFLEAITRAIALSILPAN
jgi:FixJ family two-component response regulator